MYIKIVLFLLSPWNLTSFSEELAVADSFACFPLVRLALSVLGSVHIFRVVHLCQLIFLICYILGWFLISHLFLLYALFLQHLRNNMHPNSSNIPFHFYLLCYSSLLLFRVWQFGLVERSFGIVHLLDVLTWDFDKTSHIAGLHLASCYIKNLNLVSRKMRENSLFSQ